MAKTKSKKAEVDKPEAAEVKPARSPIQIDPWNRWSPDELAWWPSWFGRRWPDRLFGEVGGLFDHMKIEEYTDDGSLVVRAEIPGVDPDEDIDISIEHGRLAIRAERSSKVEDDTDGYRSEFHYGSFSRMITLPEGVDVDDIEANYADGILEVRVPMATDDSERATKVPIGRG